jgi:GNAT superfamily N-acetyltransferase
VEELLRAGDATVRLRRLAPTDSMGELTDLLHRAYARLAAMGLNYTATTQDEDCTARRCAGGTCWVGTADGRLVATVTLRPPAADRECAWYRRPDVASFEQLAVEPALQGRGLGDLLLDRVEREAARWGVGEVACDTAAPARHLVEWYVRRGYRVVATERWPGKTYESRIVSKPVASA